MLFMPYGEEHLLQVLLWSTLILAGLVIMLVLLSSWIQWQADRRNVRRIASFQEWEVALPEYLFQDSPVPPSFLILDEDRKAFLGTFLRRFRASIGGADARKLESLYQAAGLHKDIPGLLRHASSKKRAMAATDVSVFELEELLPLVLPLLRDPMPFVAYAAARALSRNLGYAGPVFRWVVEQDRYQMDRLVQLLEGFGEPFLGWLEERLGPPEVDSLGWRIYCQLAASFRHQSGLILLQELLEVPDRELRSASIRTLQALGNPQAYGKVEPFARDEDPLLRMQAAKAIGSLGGLQAIPDLIDLLGDPSFDVRRHASMSLAKLGGAGLEALAWVSQSSDSDPFARDMAQERLEWTEHRGRL